MPATGWFAVYAEEAETNNIVQTPLICWALVTYRKLDDEQGVEGMETDLSGEPPYFCEDVHGFLGYLGPGEPVEYYHEEAGKWILVEKRRMAELMAKHEAEKLATKQAVK